MSSNDESDRDAVTLTPDGIDSGKLEDVSDDTVLLDDPDDALLPHHLGTCFSVLADDNNLEEVLVQSETEWTPDTEFSLGDAFAGDAGDRLKSLLVNLHEYDEDNPESAIRELMQTCDELMSDLKDQPEAVEALDSKLWGWFKEPPAAEQLREELDQLLQSVLGQALFETETVEDDDQSQSAVETGSPDVTDDDDDDQPEPGTSEGSSDTDASEPSGDTFVTELDADPVMVEDFLKEANEHLQQLDNLLVDVEQNPTENTLGELFRSMHTLKGGFGFCGLEACTDITHAAEDLLDVLKEDPPAEIPPIWMDLFFETLDTVRLICSALEEAVEEEAERIEADTSREFLNLLEEDLRKACDGEKDREVFESPGYGSSGEAEESAVEDQELGEETVSIELDSIGEIVDLIGELVISHSALREQLNGELDRRVENSLNKQEKILDQLQRRSMNLRMLPVKKEFDKFPRIVRDLSRELDKQIELRVEGADTEIDKSVLDSLHGPLVHLVRNACDHGLETPDERREAGKPETGHLYLRAYHESGNVYVEVEDDGAGLNRDAIESKALDRGIIDEDHDLTDQEIDELIFHQGFSTTDEVSDVSGRGVGMDVVASEIEKLRGNISVDSTPGEGTRITIELPLTVAIIDGLIARLGQERMIFPVSQVVESINPEPEDLREVQGKGKVVQVREEVFPYVEPAEFIDAVEEPDSINDRTILVLVRSHSGIFAVRVDDLISHEQVVIKSLEGYSLDENELVSGGAILGDGTVGLILDVPGMVRSYRQEETVKQEVSV